MSPRLTSLVFLLGEELYRQPRAVYKYWAGGLRSCVHAATSSSISSCSTSVSVHRQSVGHSCYASVTCIRIATVQVRGAHRSPVMDALVITQLMFLQSFEDVEVPQIPSSTECYRIQLYYRVVYVQCKLCKKRRCHSAVLGQVVHAPVVMLRQLLGEIAQVQFLDWLGHPLLYNDRCLGLAEQKTVEVPQLLCSDKVYDVPVVQVVVRVEGAPDSVHRQSWVMTAVKGLLAVFPHFSRSCSPGVERQLQLGAVM